MEIGFVGNYLGHGYNFDGATFDPCGLSPTILSRDYKGAKAIIDIRKVDMMYGENTITKSRAEQSRAEQSRAEQLNGCVRLGNVYGEQFGGGYAGNVWDANGICQSLMTMQGGGRQPHIVEVKEMKIKIRQATKEGFIDCEVPGVADLNYTDSKTRRGRVVRGGADKSYSDNGEYP